MAKYQLSKLHLILPDYNLHKQGSAVLLKDAGYRLTLDTELGGAVTVTTPAGDKYVVGPANYRWATLVVAPEVPAK